MVSGFRYFSGMSGDKDGLGEACEQSALVQQGPKVEASHVAGSVAPHARQEPTWLVSQDNTSRRRPPTPVSGPCFSAPIRHSHMTLRPITSEISSARHDALELDRLYLFEI